MLTPSYLLHAVEPAEEIAEQLHKDILDRIIARMLIRFKRGDDYILTATDKWNIELLQDAGFLLEDIQKEIAAATGKMQTEIAEAMEDAGVRTLEYDDSVYRAAGLDPVPLVQSPYLISIMQRDFEATLGEWTNVTRTTANAAHKAFINACDKAYHQALTGVISPAQAVKEALEDIVNDGVIVQYPSGHTDTIETATARAVRTGISQASAHITDARMDDMGWDTILVSSHMGARITDSDDYTNHYWWQGKFYSKSGKDTRFPPFSVCGMGNVQGIHGANCRHSHGPGDGENNPFDKYDSEENRKQYELEQRQRTLERRIRDTKRKTMNWKTAMDAETDPAQKAVFKAEYQRKAALLQKQNEAYNEFCESTGQKRRADRSNIAKWDRKQAAQARAAAKKYQKSIENSSVSDTINKKATVRKITERGEVINPMPAEEYQRIKSALNKQGIKVVAATGGDDLAYMLWMKAEGTYKNGWLRHIGEIPSRGTLYEEIIHMAQSRKYGELDTTDYVELYAREIEANRKLLKNKKAYRLDELDISDVERNLESWEYLFKERTGVSYDESGYR